MFIMENIFIKKKEREIKKKAKNVDHLGVEISN
jgi:hypothetical protein